MLADYDELNLQLEAILELQVDVVNALTKEHDSELDECELDGMSDDDDEVEVGIDDDDEIYDDDEVEVDMYTIHLLVEIHLVVIAIVLITF